MYLSVTREPSKTLEHRALAVQELQRATRATEHWWGTPNTRNTGGEH